MSFSFDAIENAFMYVSMGQEYMNHAYLCKKTGRIFYASEMYDSDELPEDIDDPDKYLYIPHPNDLDLGRPLVFEFVNRYLPGEIDRVNSIFHSPGAYSRFKALLDRKGYLDKWHDFEAERQSAALEQWCVENNIDLDA